MMRWILLLITGLLFSGCSMREVTPAPTTYRLNPTIPSVISGPSQCSNDSVKINMLHGTAIQQFIFYTDEKSHEQNRYVKSQWISSPSIQFSDLLRQSVANSGLFESAQDYDSQAESKYLLQSSLNDFSQYFDAKGNATVHAEIQLTLLNGRNMKLLESKRFDITQKCPSNDAKGAVDALNDITEKVLQESMTWLHGYCQ